MIVFVLIRLAPGDPAYLLAGDAPTPEFLEQIRRHYGLDQPVHVQLLTYLSRVLQGDLGTSIHFNRPVVSVILDRLPATITLAAAALVVAFAVGSWLGVIAGYRRGTRVDTAVSTVALLGYSTPLFWLAQLLVLVFAVTLGLLPSSGMSTIGGLRDGISHAIDLIRHMILPVTSLALFELGLITRFTRTAMIEALENDYVTVAYAKGLRTRQVLVGHAFRNALLTTVTIVGLEFGALLGGAVLTETVYAWPGVGRLTFDALIRRDFPLLSGIFIFASIAVVVVNLVTDVLYSIIDPRVLR